MDYLRRLLSRSWRRPAALSSSILNEVLLDILLCIMDFLPSESAVAFSLSWMHLKCLLGTQHFLKVASSSKDNLALLDLLALDLPNHVVCSTCRRLHNMENLGRYNMTTYISSHTCYHCNSLCFPACVSRHQSSNASEITSLFGTTAFKMVIKRYHQRPNCN
jgi:hypothetical protein